MVTILGMDIGLALGGAIFTEPIYTLPGLGGRFDRRDRQLRSPVVMGVVVFSTIGIILFNLIVDLLYAWIDPQDQTTVA